MSVPVDANHGTSRHHRDVRHTRHNGMFKARTIGFPANPMPGMTPVALSTRGWGRRAAPRCPNVAPRPLAIPG
jgi:hypothetical protein